MGVPMKTNRIITATLLVVSLFSSAKSFADYRSYSDYMDEIAEIINQVQFSNDVSYTLGGAIVSDNCAVFMTKEMFLGENGRNVFETFMNNKASFPRLLDGGTLSKHCPRYKTMTANQKGMVWVMVLTMMAHFESSCNIKAHAKGPNGTAKGFYQLHAGKEQNYDQDMEMCVKNASFSGKSSNKCALAMLEVQLVKEDGQLFSKKSYWDVLRPNGAAKKADDIQRALSKSSLCNPKII